MQRVQLIHWNAAEARERAEIIQVLGYQVAYDLSSGPSFLRTLRQEPPDAVIIDLTRLPSQGRDMGVNLRKHKTTRHVPLIFVGGDPVKVERVRSLLPDAIFTSWEAIATALSQAIANPPEDPIVPDSLMAGYAGKPLQVKLGIKEASVVDLVDAPPDFKRTLGELPPGVQLRHSPKEGSGDLIIWFTHSLDELVEGIPRMVSLALDCPVWIAWPKKTSSLAGDLTQQVVRETGLASGMVDYKICSIDKTWSGLLFTHRKK